jgi:hypothetical protein
MRENWLNEDNLMRDEAFLTQAPARSSEGFT